MPAEFVAAVPFAVRLGIAAGVGGPVAPQFGLVGATLAGERRDQTQVAAIRIDEGIRRQAILESVGGRDGKTGLQRIPIHEIHAADESAAVVAVVAALG